MNIILLLISMLCFCYVSILEALHMLQQNRYNLRRYGNWCRKHIIMMKVNWVYFIWAIPFVGIALLNSTKVLISVLTLLLYVYSYVFFRAQSQKSVIQPLVFTGRMKRLTGLLTFLLFIWFGFCFWLLPLRIFALTTALQFLAPWLLIIPAAWLILPVEQWVRHQYVLDAKRTIQANQRQLRIGITGSFGKTSVKNMMYHVLSEQYYCFKTPKSYNNLMGITRSIREHLKPVHQVFICEMGADHVHEISRLAELVEPKIGVVTAVGPQHLQTFHSIENILHEKMQLIEHLPKDGLAVINIDNDYIRNYTIQNNCRVISYGIHQHRADIKASHIRLGANGTSFQVFVDQQVYQFHTILLGEHSIQNILAALAVGWYMHIPWDLMVKAVAQIPYVEHRLALSHQFPFTLIDNAYNSNPVSARLALQVLYEMPGRHILITPGFIDLGSIENEENRLFGEIIPKYVDEVILVGIRQTKYIQKGLLQTSMDMKYIHVVKTMKEAMALCMKVALPGDTVLIENDLPDAFNH